MIYTNVLMLGTQKGSLQFQSYMEGTFNDHIIKLWVDGDYTVETTPELRNHNIGIICNKEGVMSGLLPNENLFPFFYVGYVIFVGLEGDDFTSLTLAQLNFINEYFNLSL